MAKLCGLPPADGANTIRKWEVTGPTGPVSELFRILAMASDRYPILEMFNVFDRHDVPGKTGRHAGRRSANRCATTCAAALVKQSFRARACGEAILSLPSPSIRPSLSTENVCLPIGWVINRCARQVTAFYSNAV